MKRQLAGRILQNIRRAGSGWARLSTSHLQLAGALGPGQPRVAEAQNEFVKAVSEATPDSRAAPLASGHAAEPGPDVSLLPLAYWMMRDIAAPDFLLGSIVSTTSRVEIIGPTGLGKTNLGLGMAFTMADGVDFLHWRGCGRLRRILYLDGEMSRRLMKQRLQDASRRCDSVPTTLFVLNREDYPGLPPLNTEAGQQFVDRIIDGLGGVDAVLFDNVQSLLTGDMKDPETWAPALPWVRDLTRRSIGQIWFHHTGHDTSHGYGDKTREWQLDTVGLMEAVERPGADIAFSLKFVKARERRPDNRADFDATIITLTGDKWVSDRDRDALSRKAPAKDRALVLLIDAIARHGAYPPADERIPPETLCIEEDLWRRTCAAGSISEGTPGAQDKAFRRAAAKLLGEGKVGKWNALVWVAKQ